MATHPTQYAHPEALVETDWLEKHLKDDGVRIVESNEDVLLYDTGHIPGAVHIDWRADLQDPVIRDYISPKKFAELCSRNGITPDTTCVFYGDKANWWACYALWAFRLFGHEKVKILNGGRDKWKAEQRPMTPDKRPLEEQGGKWHVYSSLTMQRLSEWSSRRCFAAAAMKSPVKRRPATQPFSCTQRSIQTLQSST